MTKKPAKWKQQIRAEVAAALQGRPTTDNKTNEKPTRPESKPGPRPEAPPAAARTVSTRLDPAIRGDLKWIGLVTIGLVALLSVAAITDRGTSWLDRLASSVADRLASWSARPATTIAPELNTPR